MEKNNFPPLGDGENLILTIRRHYITLIFTTLYILAGAIILILLFSFKTDISAMLSEKIFYLIVSIFVIIFSSVIFMIFINTELDILFVTNKKIIYHEQISFLSRQVVEFDHKNIQEIRFKISGLLPNIFGYGELSILTAGNDKKITFPYTKNPQETIAKINAIIQESKKL